MDGDQWLAVGVGLVMGLGLVGTVLPFFPGLPLIWGAALVFGINVGWDTSGVIAMSVITVLMLAGIAAKVVLPARSAAETGAPRSTLVLGALFGVVGFFVVPVVGLPLGAVVGILVAEFRRTRDWDRAWRSTRSAIVGFGMGALLEIAAGLAMIVAWVFWAL
jgi:uncharacterized protein YqgC (DUF456 family)